MNWRTRAHASDRSMAESERRHHKGYRLMLAIDRDIASALQMMMAFRSSPCLILTSVTSETLLKPPA